MMGLSKLMGRRDRPPTAGAVEGFKDTKITRALGQEILRGTPLRRNHIQGMRDCLTSMSREEKDELVDRVFARLALFVFDLPASEDYHHARRFGLLEHLLEVAHETARELSGPGFQVSPEHAINEREGPLWVYAGIVAAIAHDIGKPLDLDVVAPGESEYWDPRREPLRLFCERHGLSQTAPELWHFHPGRGDSHEHHIETLLPMVLTPEVERYLGPRLASVRRSLSSREPWSVSTVALEPAHEVIKIMRRRDQESSLRDREANGQRDVRPVQTEPAPELLSPLEGESSGRVSSPSLTPAGEGEAAGLAADPRDPRPHFLPADYWEESIPKSRARRGDPTETERKLSADLHPAKFLDILRRMIVGCRLDRNGLYSEAYLRPDYVWLVIPVAFRRTAFINHLPYDTGVVVRMLDSLRQSPQVEPRDPTCLPLFIRTRPDSPTFKAVRIKTRGFLSDSELAELGIHQFEIKVVAPPVLEGTPR